MKKQQIRGDRASPLVYIVTLNWNRREETLTCLHSLQRSVYPNYRLLVVDNGSTDGSVETIRRQVPAAEVLVNECNLGFAAGANVGLRYALSQGAGFVFLVNNDTTVHPQALDELVRAARSPDVGMAAPVIYYQSAPTVIWSVGGGWNPLLLEMTGGHGRGPDDGRWTEVVERPVLVGCGLLLRRELLEQVGLFDERFFLYYEDSDLCLRARAAGFRLLLVPSAKMWHKVATSSGGSDAPAERYQMARSSVLFFRKHARLWQTPFIVPYRTASAVKTVARLLLRRRPDAARAYLRGLRDGLRLRPRGANLS
ncbi:MAG: glycosyltransferase family 2 protein [Chloroflexi bacterium]|nr:glycosyltransferase family 2 protein [Chloroflexota bacterium]